MIGGGRCRPVYRCWCNPDRIILAIPFDELFPSVSAGISSPDANSPQFLPISTSSCSLPCDLLLAGHVSIWFNRWSSRPCYMRWSQGCYCGLGCRWWLEQSPLLPLASLNRPCENSPTLPPILQKYQLVGQVAVEVSKVQAIFLHQSWSCRKAVRSLNFDRGFQVTR